VETTLEPRRPLRIFGQDRAFDVVLCDLQMPEMFGFRTVRDGQASAGPSWPSGFIFITGGACSPEARRFLESPGVALYPQAVPR